MTWRYDGGGQHGVEILDLVLAAFAMGTVRTTDLVRAVVLGAVPCDQHLAIEDPHGIQPATLLQLGHDIGKHRVEQGWFDRVEHGANLAFPGDLADAEQRLAIRAAVSGLQMPLVCQEGRALHEERSKGGESEVGHGIGRVFATPAVRQGLAVTAQRGDQAILDVHPYVESQFAIRANRENRKECRSSRQCDIWDSPAARRPQRKPLFK
jgi:hypothetical protein